MASNSRRCTGWRRTFKKGERCQASRAVQRRSIGFSLTEVIAECWGPRPGTRPGYTVSPQALACGWTMPSTRITYVVDVKAARFSEAMLLSATCYWKFSRVLFVELHLILFSWLSRSCSLVFLKMVEG